MLALDLAELLGLAVNLSGKIADTSIAAAALTSIRGRGAGDRVGLLGHQPRPGGRCGADPDHRHRGSVDVPGGPGLGVDVDEDAVTHYRVTDVG